jgi:hypothetical protein
MIAAILDLVASRKSSMHQRKELDREIRSILNQVYQRFREFCIAVPALTQGDTIEVLSSSWRPLFFLFHYLLMEGLEFRVGLGTGKIIVRNENADECDGPAFWNAREALDDVKQKKYMARTAGFSIDKVSPPEEKDAVIYSILFLTTLLGLTQKQLRHCFYRIWEKKQITGIADEVRSSVGNVSKSLSGTPCYLLASVLAYLDEH